MRPGAGCGTSGPAASSSSTEHVACVQQVRDLLECVWPAALEAAAQPFRSVTWLAALTVVIERDGGDLDRTRRLGFGRFERAVRKEITRRGRTKPCLRIARKIFAALSDTGGVLAHRCGAFERIGWVIEDWDDARAKLAAIEARMVAVLDELELTELVTTIDGPVPGRGRGHPRRDRRPDPLHLRPRRGQTRRSGPAGTNVGHLHRPGPPQRRRPAAG